MAPDTLKEKKETHFAKLRDIFLSMGGGTFGRTGDNLVVGSRLWWGINVVKPIMFVIGTGLVGESSVLIEPTILRNIVRDTINT